ncbi:hypothetical protein [Actinotalea sp. JY-7876]|uniref:hypothetical protein n=2 Tax=unclassified Actinotalea TaxID=2638618 RepID=UPI0015F4789B|nr:hypothetical protein [Actinotalea sp. JY-7876]
MHATSGRPATRRGVARAFALLLALTVTAGAGPLPGGAAERVSRSAAVSPAATSGAPAAAPAMRPAADVSTIRTVTPVRLLTSRLEPGESVTVRVPAVPAEASAAVLNVTAADASAVTTLSTCGAAQTCPAESMLAASPGPVTPGQVLAPLSEGGEVTLSNRSGGVTVYVDLNGFVLDATTADQDGFVPVDPRRIMSWQGVGVQQTVTLTVPDVPDGATAVALDLGYAAATRRGYVSACPAGTAVRDCARTSVLNPAPGANRSNFAVVGLGGPRGDQVVLYNHRGSVRLNADLQGFFVAADTGKVHAASAPLLEATLAAGESRTIRAAGAPAGATAAKIQVRAHDAQGGTALTVCPGTQVAGACAATSVLNPYPGRDSTNVAYVRLGEDGALTVRNTSASVGVTMTLLGLVGPLDAPAAPPAAPVPPPAAPAPTPTPTPAPSPAPPPAVGAVEPTAATTGVPDGTPLTRHDGDLVITEPGTVIDGKDIHGFVSIRAADVTIRNSVVRGSGTGSYSTGLVSCLDAACRGAVIEDTTLVPKQPSPWITGILGHDYTARRVDVHHVVDGFGIFDTGNGGGPVDVVIESSWCHDLSYFARDPQQDGGPSHNDCIQIQGGSAIRITGNSLESFMSTAVGDQSYDARNRGAGLMVTPTVAPVTGATVTKNWFDGGYASVSVSRGGYERMHFGTLTGNRFGRNQFDHGRGSRYVIRVREGVTFDSSLTGNVWADGAGPLALGRDLGIRYDP